MDSVSQHLQDAHHKPAPATRHIGMWVSPATAYPQSSTFVWRGIGNATTALESTRHAAQITLQVMGEMEGQKSAGVTGLPKDQILIAPLPNSRAGRNDLTHSISFSGEPFISPGGDEEKFCFEAGAADFATDQDDYVLAAKIQREATRILMLDPAVRNAVVHGDHEVTVQFHAGVDVKWGLDGRRQPHREVGFNIYDRNSTPIMIDESTANAVLMLMLLLRGTSHSWKQFQPLTIPASYLDYTPVARLKEERLRLESNPSVLLGGPVWWLTCTGLTELAAHVVRMAENALEEL